MNFEKEVVNLLSDPNYHPMTKKEILKNLRVEGRDTNQALHVIKKMTDKGTILCLKQDRYCLPKEVDLVVGTLWMNEKGFGFVSPDRQAGDEIKPDIYIRGENLDVALHKDKVCVRTTESKRFGRDKSPGGSEKVEGQVVRIVERARTSIVGTLQKSPNFFYVVPDEPRIPHDIYVKPYPGAQINDKVVVKLLPWEKRNINPEGEIIEVLGSKDDPGVDMISIIRKFELRTEFPVEVNDEVRDIEFTIPSAEYKRRLDVRRNFIITIDPDDAKDYDDAVEVDHLKNGDWELGVHIADVSYYVRPGTAMDKEAQARGNSVYLVDRVLPMLPEHLSNGLCSLKEGVDRLTKSAYIIFSPKGQIKSYRFENTVICSRKRLTYKQAFALLNGADEVPINPFQRADVIPDHTPPTARELSAKLQEMWALASLLRKNRFENGSLELDFPEVKVRVDKSGRPTAIDLVENDISHQLIEEFMLSANEVTALETKNRSLNSVYRIHEKPDSEKLNEFRETLVTYNYRVGDLSQKREVQKFLGMIKGKPEEYALKLGFLKSLKRATYSPKPLGHYGLAKVNYTHFTSPIRRYSDLIVHRVINGQVTGKPQKLQADKLGEISAHISDTERNAAEAEQESVKLKKLEFFALQLEDKKKRQKFKASILDIRNYGMLVELPQFLLSGLVPVSCMDDDFYTYMPERKELVGRKNKRKFRAGDTLEVVVARVDMFKRQVDFALA